VALAEHRTIVYEVFDAALTDEYVKQLSTFGALFRVSNLSLTVLTTPAQLWDNYAALLRRWRDGQRKMAHDVRAALRASSSFTFATRSMMIVCRTWPT
jgi:hypothetical protein